MGPFEISRKQRNLYLAVVVCYSTSFTIAWPCKNTTASQFAKDFYERVCVAYSTPALLISDRGSTFTSHVYNEMGHKLGIRLCRTTPYSPTSNARVERKNQSILNLLRCMCIEEADKWDEFVPSVVFALNNSVTFPNSLTPAILVFGRNQNSILDTTRLQDPQTRSEIMEEILTAQRSAQKVALKAQAIRHREMADAYNAQVKDSTIVVGDEVGR